MNNKYTKISTFLALLIINQVSFSYPRESGTYVEGNIGTNYSSFHLFGIDYSGFNSIGFNTNLGYQFNRYLALETGVTRYASSVYAVDAALKAILPVTPQSNAFRIFGKIGSSYVFSSNDHSILLYLGLGGAYALTPNLDINLQAQGVTIGYFSMGLLSAGLTYYF